MDLASVLLMVLLLYMFLDVYHFVTFFQLVQLMNDLYLIVHELMIEMLSMKLIDNLDYDYNDCYYYYYVDCVLLNEHLIYNEVEPNFVQLYLAMHQHKSCPAR